MSEDKKKEPNPKRVELARLSDFAEELREQKVNEAESEQEALFWASRTINYMLLHCIYDTKEATEFNTFNQWKTQNATVKKGEKAFLIWGQPVRKFEKPEDAPPEQEETEKYKFFPLCYLFSDKQVRFAEDYREKESSEAPEQPQEYEPINLDEYF